MANILVNGTIHLPADLYWENEFSWSPNTMKEARSVTGALILQIGKKIGGQKITLKSGVDNAWVTRVALGGLKELQKSLPTPSFTLAFADGRSYNVVFDDTAGPAISSEAKQPGKVPASTDYFSVTLLFMVV